MQPTAISHKVFGIPPGGMLSQFYTHAAPFSSLYKEPSSSDIMRAITIKNLLDKKHDTYTFDGEFAKVFGNPSTSGCWLIYGNDKNGKTRFAVLLGDYLSKYSNVLYVSAEEGTDKAFAETFRWAKVGHTSRIHIVEYESITEIRDRLLKRRSPRIVIIDNLTIYSEELKPSHVKKLLADNPHTLFIFLAHEERREPYTASAKMAKKLAKIIIHVKGMSANIQGRCPGGRLLIDEEKALLFHGHDKKEETNELLRKSTKTVR